MASFLLLKNHHFLPYRLFHSAFDRKFLPKRNLIAEYSHFLSLGHCWAWGLYAKFHWFANNWGPGGSGMWFSILHPHLIFRFSEYTSWGCPLRPAPSPPQLLPLELPPMSTVLWMYFSVSSVVLPKPSFPLLQDVGLAQKDDRWLWQHIPCWWVDEWLCRLFRGDRLLSDLFGHKDPLWREVLSLAERRFLPIRRRLHNPFPTILVIKCYYIFYFIWTARADAFM